MLNVDEYDGLSESINSTMMLQKRKGLRENTSRVRRGTIVKQKKQTNITTRGLALV